MDFVKMMIVAVIISSLVALYAKVVALFLQFQTVNIVAIGATYVVLMHLALGKRSINIIFFAYLPVSIIIGLNRELRTDDVKQFIMGMDKIAKGRTACMTVCALVNHLP